MKLPSPSQIPSVPLTSEDKPSDDDELMEIGYDDLGESVSNVTANDQNVEMETDQNLVTGPPRVSSDAQLPGAKAVQPSG